MLCNQGDFYPAEFFFSYPEPNCRFPPELISLKNPPPSNTRPVPDVLHQAENNLNPIPDSTLKSIDLSSDNTTQITKPEKKLCPWVNACNGALYLFLCFLDSTKIRRIKITNVLPSSLTQTPFLKLLEFSQQC